MTAGKPWFSARILMESVHQAADPGPKLFEDKVILVRADSEKAAHSRAKGLARAMEEEYLNADGHTVRWEFRGVLDVVQLFDEELAEGSEVYYKFLGADDLEAVRRSLEAGRLG